jgi:Patatin-like phospholipase
LSTEVFKADEVLKGIIPLRDDQCRFSYRDLERVIKDMVRTRLGNESVGMSAVTDKPSCRTFVVANLAEDADGPPIFFRSYDVRGHGLANTCPIWQAARATSAAPTFFKPMLVDDPPPAVPYVDGGLRYNNPSQLAVEEVRRIWPGRTPTCLISIGTGRQRSVQVYDPKVLAEDSEAQRSVLEYVKGAFPEILNYLPKGKSIKNFPQGVVAVLKMANVISQVVTSSQPSHLHLQDDNNRPPTFKYFRFDVEREVGDIGLADITQNRRLAGLVMGYLKDSAVINKKLECVKCFASTNTFRK